MGYMEKELLSDGLVSAKRTPHERKGIHAWHPYYAGYSEKFVESALRYLGCTPESLVLDPWAGSGTTCVVASRNQIASIGVDINPVMANFAGAKSPEVLGHKEEIIAFFEAFKAKAKTSSSISESDPLLETYAPETALMIRRLWIEIHRSTGSIQSFDGSSQDQIDVKIAFMSAVLFVTLRQFSGVKKLANPTWIGRSEDLISIDVEDFRAELVVKAKEMLGALESFYEKTEMPREIYAMVGDAKALNLPDDSIDCVITSPPYLTRIDYAISTAPELTIFGIEDLVTSVRHATTGAPVITKEVKQQRESWGPMCNSILNRVKAHESKAASSYYWKNMAQYFMDIDQALDELKRVLRPGGKGLIVVQSSYFKEIEVPLGPIYVEMALGKGLNSSIAYRDEVRNHMAHVNTRSNKYMTNKIFFEDTVFIEKSA